MQKKMIIVVGTFLLLVSSLIGCAPDDGSRPTESTVENGTEQSSEMATGLTPPLVFEVIDDLSMLHTVEIVHVAVVDEGTAIQYDAIIDGTAARSIRYDQSPSGDGLITVSDDRQDPTMELLLSSEDGETLSQTDVFNADGLLGSLSNANPSLILQGEELNDSASMLLLQFNPITVACLGPAVLFADYADVSDPLKGSLDGRFGVKKGALWWGVAAGIAGWGGLVTLRRCLQIDIVFSESGGYHYGFHFDCP